MYVVPLFISLRSTGPKTGDKFIREAMASPRKKILYIQLGLDWVQAQLTGARSLGNFCARIVNLPEGELANRDYLVSIDMFAVV